jgi:hypothetical protein
MLTPNCIGGLVAHSDRCLVGRVSLDALFLHWLLLVPNVVWLGCCVRDSGRLWVEFGVGDKAVGHPRSRMGYEVLLFVNGIYICNRLRNVGLDLRGLAVLSRSVGLCW